MRVLPIGKIKFSRLHHIEIVEDLLCIWDGRYARNRCFLTGKISRPLTWEGDRNSERMLYVYTPVFLPLTGKQSRLTAASRSRKHFTDWERLSDPIHTAFSFFSEADLPATYPPDTRLRYESLYDIQAALSWGLNKALKNFDRALPIWRRGSRGAYYLADFQSTNDACVLPLKSVERRLQFTLLDTPVCYGSVNANVLFRAGHWYFIRVAEVDQRPLSCVDRTPYCNPDNCFNVLVPKEMGYIVDFDVSSDGRYMVICYRPSRKARSENDVKNVVELYTFDGSGVPYRTATFDIDAHRCCFAPDNMTFALLCWGPDGDHFDRVCILDVE